MFLFYNGLIKISSVFLHEKNKSPQAFNRLADLTILIQNILRISQLTSAKYHHQIT